MKKFGILLIGMLLVASFAVAQEVTMSGSATFTIGTDLDAQTFGFKNESSSSLEVEWTFDDSATEGQGFIKLSDMSLLIDSDEDDLVVMDAPDVEAGWMTGPLTVTIWAKPDLTGGNAAGYIFLANDDEVDDDEVRDEAEIEIETNNVAVAAEDPFSSGELTVITNEDYIEETTDSDYALDPYLDDAVPYDVDQDGTTDFWYYVDDTTKDAELDEFYGVTVDVDLGVAAVTVIVATDGDWEENLDNSFAFGGIVSVPTDMVTLEVGAWAGVAGSELGAVEHPTDFAFTIGADGMVGPLSFDAGYDSIVPGAGGNWSIDASLALGVEVAGIAVDTLSYVKFIGVDTDLDQEVVLDLSGLVEGVTLTETVQLPELLSAAFDQWYSLTTIGFGAATLEVGVDQEAVLDLNVSLELDGLVENTVFTIEWDVEDAWYKSLGTLTASGKISY
jgi:hypothetical protein